MKEKVVRLYSCPVCNNDYAACIPRELEVNLCRHFPDTYGLGYLICDACLPARLEALRS